MDGSFVDNFTSFGVIQSIGIDWDEESNLYVSSYQSDDVRKFDIEGNDLGLFINSDLAGPTNIFFDSNGDLLVLDYDGTSVKRFDSNGDLIGDFITGLDNCEGYAHLPDGNILIGNGGSSSVKLFDSNGDYIEDLISSGSGNLINPNAIVIREMVVNSIPEPHVNEMAILLPSFGTAFSVNPKLLAAKNGIKVYSLSGEFICSIKYDTWNANDIPSGSYIISVLLENSLLTQKIIIEK